MNPTTASNGNEWQTAGKPKSAKPKPKPKPEPSSVDAVTTNGYSSGDGLHLNNHSNQNGSMQNGSSRRGGRQSSAGSYGGRSNQTTISNAQYSRPTSSKEDALSKRKLLEKEAKNIEKRDAAIEQAGKLFDEEIGRSRERIRQAFNEIRDQLNERERIILEELDNCKKQGDQLLHQREDRAKELKDGATCAFKMNDRQMDDLRSQIRRFMNDHRLEDELGSTARFRYEPDRLIDLVKNYGEVVAIGGNSGAEPQKHSSMSSLVSSADGDGSHVGGNKSVTEIALGGIMMKSDSMDADQLVELTRSLRENLKLQGIAEDILPEVCGSSVMMPPRRRPAPPQRDASNGGRGGGPNRNGGGSQRR